MAIYLVTVMAMEDNWFWCLVIQLRGIDLMKFMNSVMIFHVAYKNRARLTANRENRFGLTPCWLDSQLSSDEQFDEKKKKRNRIRQPVE